MNHATPEVASRVGTFTQLLSSMPRGARLAPLLAVTELRSWGGPAAGRQPSRFTRCAGRGRGRTDGVRLHRHSLGLSHAPGRLLSAVRDLAERPAGAGASQ